VLVPLPSVSLKTSEEYMSEIDFIALQAASEAFATDRLPDNWMDLSDEEQIEWLGDNRWCHFENDTTDSFYALIDTHADHIKDAISDVLDLLKDKLIEALIQNELTDDFTGLDLHGLLGMQ
jgi:hypothetical protein